MITGSESNRFKALANWGEQLRWVLNNTRDTERVGVLTRYMVQEVNRIREYHDLPPYGKPNA